MNAIGSARSLGNSPLSPVPSNRLDALAARLHKTTAEFEDRIVRASQIADRLLGCSEPPSASGDAAASSKPPTVETLTNLAEYLETQAVRMDRQLNRLSEL